MKKKIVCVLTVLCILIGMVGCVNVETTNPQQQNTSKTSQEVSQSIPEKQDETTQKENKNLPEKLDNPNITMIGTNANFAKNNLAVQQFEEMYGGKFELMVVERQAFDAKLTSMMLAGETPELVGWTQNSYPVYMINELVQPIEEYFDFDINDPVWAERLDVMEQFKWKEKVYGVSRTSAGSGVGMLVFNTSLFEMNGVKTPLEYYSEGNWTWDTFREVAMKLTKDTDNDGVIDQWGFAQHQDIEHFLLSNGTDLIKFEDDGSIVLNLKDERVIEALQFYQDGYYKEQFINKIGNNLTDFVSGNFAMTADYGSTISRIANEMPKEVWDIAPFPTAPQGKGMTSGNASFWGIGNGCKNPEGAAAFIYLDQMNVTFGEEPNLLEVFTVEQLELIKEMKQNKIMVATHKGLGKVPNVKAQMVKEIINGVSISSLIEKYTPLFQAEIDAFMEEHQ